MRVYAYAKLNLILHILNKREDGYHELQSVMQSVSLADVLTLTRTSQDIILHCSSSEIPCDQRNTVYKAAELLRKRGNISSGVEITIEKHIPWGAGLAGGSADAAAAIMALNTLWELKLPEAELFKIGAQVGSDVPFCMKGGTILAEGRGERLSPLPSVSGVSFLLVTPPLNISTAWVYQQIPKTYSKSRQNVQEHLDGNVLAALLWNDLEQFVIPQHPIIAELKSELVRYGAMASLMSGSGSTVFGVFNEESALQKAYTELKKQYSNTFMVQPVTGGVLLQ